MGSDVKEAVLTSANDLLKIVLIREANIKAEKIRNEKRLAVEKAEKEKGTFREPVTEANEWSKGGG